MLVSRTLLASALVGFATALDIPIDISGFFNNKATSIKGEHSGRGFSNGSTYDAACLPTGAWGVDGHQYDLPVSWDELELDNVACEAQTIPIPIHVAVRSVNVLISGEYWNKQTEDTLVFEHADGSTTIAPIDVRNWWTTFTQVKAAIHCDHNFNADESINRNSTYIHHVSVPLTNPSPLVAVVLPQPAKMNPMHVFALSLTPTEGSLALFPLEVAAVRGTRKWEDLEDGTRLQVVELTVRNPLSLALYDDQRAWIKGGVILSMKSNGFRTVKPGTFNRLMPSDEKVVKLLIEPTLDLADNETDDEVEITVSLPNHASTLKYTANWEGVGVITDFTEWTEDWDSITQHESPDWFNDAKYGIFVHWGLYSVPAWSNFYAEWYWYWVHYAQDAGSWMSNGGLTHGLDNLTFLHHREVYGEDFVYDDFAKQFKGEKFDPKAWIDLFHDAGAKYFVMTTKHHDGFCLFDAEGTTNRTSVKLAPGGRDYIRELFDANNASGYGLKSGVYYSMPEFFNPAYKKYGREVWRGGPAESAYHEGVYEPYTGHIPIDDYIEDLQLPHMTILANNYQPDIMWCDIGTPHHSEKFAADWYRNMTQIGKQVTLNDRCGIPPDFSTPEYHKFRSAQSHKWESTEGIDPFSFGYNSRSKFDEYKTGPQIVHNLVDIVSKNGNYLLDVGPTGPGEILDVFIKPLLVAGSWLKTNGHAIYKTVPFSLAAEIDNGDVDVRFTQTESSFNIISLKRPTTPVFRVPAKLPVLQGDLIMFMNRTVPFKWNTHAEQLEIEVTDELLDDAEIAWTFSVSYDNNPHWVVQTPRDEL